MELTFLGVRGSTPAVGPLFTTFGGHTSCVAVRLANEDRPAVILDAGTGIRDLDTLMGGEPFTGAVLLTHLHWDHIQGLPFSSALARAGATVETYLPADAAEHAANAAELLGRGLGPPFFPVTPLQLGERWRFSYLPAEFELPGGVRVLTAEVRHKGGRTLGIRLQADGGSVAYLPDHDLAQPDPRAVEFARGADVLVHDGQYLAEDIAGFRGYGHSVVNRACELADEAEVGSLILTHHAPDRTDESLEELARRYVVTPGGRPVRFARQGDRVAVASGNLR